MPIINDTRRPLTDRYWKLAALFLRFIQIYVRFSFERVSSLKEPYFFTVFEEDHGQNNRNPKHVTLVKRR